MQQRAMYVHAVEVEQCLRVMERCFSGMRSEPDQVYFWRGNTRVPIDRGYGVHIGVWHHRFPKPQLYYEVNDELMKQGLVQASPLEAFAFARQFPHQLDDVPISALGGLSFRTRNEVQCSAVHCALRAGGMTVGREGNRYHVPGDRLLVVRT